MPLPPFDQLNILVVGDIMLDHYSSGLTERISPEAPVPVINIQHTEQRLGGAANVAKNIASLGCSVHLHGHAGDDRAGQQLAQLLNEAQIHNHLTTHKDNSTIIKHRVISQQQQLLRLDTEHTHDHHAFPVLLDALIPTLPDQHAIVLSDYAKGTLLDPQRIIQQANQHHIPVLVDPKGADFNKYRNSTLLTPNRHEFEHVVGSCLHIDQYIERGIQLMQSLNLTALLVTLGKDGMLLLQQDEAPLHIHAKSQAVFDVTGAGDTVIAVIASLLAAQTPLSQAVEYANLAAGIVIQHVGTTSITPKELQLAMDHHALSTTKITDHHTLANTLRQLQSNNKKIVFTNGCFDLLHAGHVDYLEQAKALGDYLVVAVNSDASVKRLKGDSRPLNTLNERMRVLAGLGCIDWITSFNEETPAQLIDVLKPNVLVKGGDYQPENIVGADTVKALGGTVTTIPFRPNCSTTNIINRIQQEEVIS